MSEDINEIYKRINSLLNQDSYEDVEKILREVDFVETPTMLLVGYLSISFAGYKNEKISSEVYEWFYDSVYDILSIIGEDPKKTLFGLSPKERISE